MKEFCILKNAIQEYAWGSHTAIAELLGARVPSSEPQAELWMGAHPRAPSEILVDEDWRPLPAALEHSPLEILGPGVADAFGRTLPFLFKVLAAAKPLSIQAHPNLLQAREGFARENEMGIPIDAPNRNYRDANHKPELICALTPFWALNGFRKTEAVAGLLGKMDSPVLSATTRALERDAGAAGLEHFFHAIMTMPKSRRRRTVDEAVTCARKYASDDPAFEWVLKLDAEYPGDVGVLSPLFLNLVELQPGQALFLDAGRLHSYLGGTGMELMANSDNVLRGGLTPKHIDVPELLAVLNFEHQEVVVIEPEERGPCERAYRTSAREFELAVIHVSSGSSYRSAEERSVEIMICVNGGAVARNLESNATLELTQGMSVLVPAALRSYAIEGTATLYKASVPR